MKGNLDVVIQTSVVDMLQKLCSGALALTNELKFRLTGSVDETDVRMLNEQLGHAGFFEMESDDTVAFKSLQSLQCLGREWRLEYRQYQSINGSGYYIALSDNAGNGIGILSKACGEEIIKFPPVRDRNSLSKEYFKNILLTKESFIGKPDNFGMFPVVYV